MEGLLSDSRRSLDREVVSATSAAAQDMKTSERPFHVSIPALIAAALGVLDWAVFRPAIMSSDSLGQYGEALSQHYLDWHPAIMSIFVHWSFRAGGFPALTLVQSVAGTLGVFALANVLLRSKTEDGREQWIALGVLAFLLIPISPLAFYLMTFLGDSWEAIAFLWIGALAISLGRQNQWSRGVIVRAVAAAAVIGLCATVKHNTVAILPLLCFLLYAAVPGPRIARLSIVTLALAMFLLFDGALPKVYAVKHAYPENAIMGLDLVGMCIQSQAVCGELPYTNAHLNKAVYRSVYDFGNINQLLFVEPLVTDRAYMNMRSDGSVLGPAPALRAEYIYAVRRFPLQFAWVKLRGFVPLLSFDSWFWLPYGIKPNPYGLQPNGLTGIANALASFARRVRANPVARLPFAGHLPWIMVGFALGILSWRQGEKIVALVLLVCLGYCLTYLAATPSHDFRYMYPASLVVQVIAISSLIQWLRTRGAQDKAALRHEAGRVGIDAIGPS